ncbi:hypothetical protein OKW42_001733 [Paraburkholderia sp. WC7.3d]
MACNLAIQRRYLRLMFGAQSGAHLFDTLTIVAFCAPGDFCASLAQFPASEPGSRLRLKNQIERRLRCAPEAREATSSHDFSEPCFARLRAERSSAFL